ncbi:unc50 RNA binding protein [Arctopsyche grandis]|uniref:unc50 RNA binding protein n=1 Tax=Arctopsyche grandis TaxID=121162 RepID=UPI00406D7B7F
MKYPTSPVPSEKWNNFPRSSSPLPAPANFQSDTQSAASKRYKYLRRIFKFSQMDFEYGLWQMVYLFIAPQKVYRNFQYRKQTKSQFARDDPAFLVLLSIWLCVSSLGFAFILDLKFFQFIVFLLYVIFVDFIGAGLLVATCFWYVCNKYLRRDPLGQDVEWGYAFDVHMNAFFPPLTILHFFQLVLFHNFLSSGGYLSCIVGNFFWLMSFAYYIYITFLGYSCLPILQNTRLLLIPLPILILTYFVTLACGWNISLSLTNFYLYRVIS